MIYDVHSHAIEAQCGGFILSIENSPSVPGGQSFDVISQNKLGDNYNIVRYVTKSHVENKVVFDDNILYLHFRRENIEVEDLIKFLSVNKVRLVVLDTFSKFLLEIRDYHVLTRAFPEKLFLLAHGGGYEAQDFIQLVRYSSNCYIDFSATQSIFKFNRPSNDFERNLRGLLFHCFSEPRLSEKILFGSDNPEFNQYDMIAFYQKYSLVNIVNTNYINLISRLEGKHE